MISAPIILVVGVVLWYYWKHRQGHTQSIVFGILFGILIGATAFGAQVRDWTNHGVKSGVTSVTDTTDSLQKTSTEKKK